MKIIDIVRRGERYNVVLDAKPTFLYEEVQPDFFLGQAGFLYKALSYRKGDTEAFAGHNFEITLTDGTKRMCKGDHWDADPSSVTSDELVSVGYATQTQLRRCFIFTSATAQLNVIKKFLEVRQAHTLDYYEQLMKETRW